MTTELPYRPCVGVVLANAKGEVFVGERIDTPGAWQMPQGGIDTGETPENAAIRELYEETGVPAALVTVIAEHPDWIPYDLPEHLQGKLWGGRYRGQEQKWFLLRFQGDDSIIDLKAKDEEFAQWRWSTFEDALENIVPFKRPVYQQVLTHFAPLLAG